MYINRAPHQAYCAFLGASSPVIVGWLLMPVQKNSGRYYQVTARRLPSPPCRVRTIGFAQDIRRHANLAGVRIADGSSHALLRRIPYTGASAWRGPGRRPSPDQSVMSSRAQSVALVLTPPYLEPLGHRTSVMIFYAHLLWIP